jgi:signal transduction histidine kinase
LRRLLGEIALLVRPSCQHAGVDLRLGPEGDPLDVLVDEAGLRAAVLNLALNAIEAAGPGGRVSLGASAGRGEVVIEVGDTGTGPPPEVSGRLFEAFVTSKPEGVGLGLAVAHQAAVDHGGRLSWSRQGGETRFRLALPTGNGISGGDA